MLKSICIAAVGFGSPMRWLGRCASPKAIPRSVETIIPISKLPGILLFTSKAMRRSVKRVIRASREVTFPSFKIVSFELSIRFAFFNPIRLINRPIPPDIP